MIQRHLEHYLQKVRHQYPVLTVIGPRQSGKSTLVRHIFSDYSYTSLEDPNARHLALEDPTAFFHRHGDRVIIDEVQRVPDLLSFIQTMVDEPDFKGQFVLTGSHQFLLMEKVTQSLAGRTVIAKLLPLSHREFLVKPPFLFQPLPSGPSKTIPRLNSLDQAIYQGGYPRIHDKKLSPTNWLQQYVETYVERDVRQLLHVDQLDLFDRFIRLCAGRVGQLLNLASLGNDCGISQPTARSWLSVLQASFVTFTLAPHFRNFHKRLIKAPKLYFYDTGLLCYLLKINDPQRLEDHPFRGAIFENWVISELMKSYWNQGEEAPLYFWRDSNGNEVDLIIDRGETLYPIEIKSALTFHADFIKTLCLLNELQGISSAALLGECLYAGIESFPFKGYLVRSWSDL